MEIADSVTHVRVSREMGVACQNTYMQTLNKVGCFDVSQIIII